MEQNTTKSLYIVGSGIFFDSNSFYPNFLPQVPVNHTIPLFGPRSWRNDNSTNSFNELTNDTVDIAYYFLLRDASVIAISVYIRNCIDELFLGALCLCVYDLFSRSQICPMERRLWKKFATIIFIYQALIGKVYLTNVLNIYL